MRYIPRILEEGILSASEQFPVVLVTGPRQTGKTTLLQHIAHPSRRYVSLDSLPTRILAREDPELFVQTYPPPVLIDEIQYAPELLPVIKRECDSRQQTGLFWLTGSQQFHLMQGVSESLAGRAAIVKLNGISERELRQIDIREPFLPSRSLEQIRFPSVQRMVYREPDIFQRIFQGSYPAVLSGKVTDIGLFYSSYVQTYLERDVRDLTQVGNLESFFTFLRVIASRTGSILNLSDIARDCALSVPTVKQWLSILVATSLVYLLQPWTSNKTSRLIKSPKLYFLDTGLSAWLAGYSTPETLSSGPLRGAIFETWCVSEILKSWWYSLKEPPLYYYRDKEGKEIDLLFEVDGAVHPIEIKLAATVRKDWARPLSVLEKLKVPVSRGAILCLVQEPFPLDRTTLALPVGWI